MSGLGLGCLVCIWSARQHETGRFAARQCKVETVGVYGLSTERPSRPEAPHRSENPFVELVSDRRSDRPLPALGLDRVHRLGPVRRHAGQDIWF